MFLLKTERWNTVANETRNVVSAKNYKRSIQVDLRRVVCLPCWLQDDENINKGMESNSYLRNSNLMNATERNNMKRQRLTLGVGRGVGFLHERKKKENKERISARTFGFQIVRLWITQWIKDHDILCRWLKKKEETQWRITVRKAVCHMAVPFKTLASTYPSRGFPGGRLLSRLSRRMRRAFFFMGRMRCISSMGRMRSWMRGRMRCGVRGRGNTAITATPTQVTGAARKDQLINITQGGRDGSG